MIESRRVEWVGHVARKNIRKIYPEFPSENLKGKGILEDTGVAGSVILNN